MMRVLQVTPRYLPGIGGVENHVSEVAPRLVTAGMAVTVLTTDLAGTLPREEEVNGVRIIRVRAWPRSTDLYAAPGLARIISDQSWDMIHVQGVHTLVPPVAMIAALRSGCPYVLSLHTGGHRSMIRTQLRDLQWVALRPLLARARRIIGVSRFEARHFKRLLRLPAAQFAVVPNGAGFAGWEPAAGTMRDSSAAMSLSSGPLLVSVGRLERFKGHHRVIEALPHLLSRWPGTRLLVLGEGPYRSQLERIAERLHVADRVDFRAIPSSDRAAMAAALARADLVALLSDYEAHPLAIMEALAVGRPVVVTDSTGLHDLVEDGLATGIPRGSRPAVVAAVIDEVLRAPVQARSVALPTWDQCVARLIEVYRLAAAS